MSARYLSFRPVVHALLFALLVLVGACRCEDKGAGAGSAAAPAPKELPKPPPGLLAELVMAEPKAFWSRVQNLAGDHARTLPVNPELLLASMLGLPALSAGSFDLTSAVAGALLDRHPAMPALVLAVRVSSGRELLAQLTSGSAPPFTVKSFDGGYSVLAPMDKGQAFRLAVLKNHLIVSTDSGVEPNVARFLMDILAEQPAPAGVLTFTSKRDALRGPVSKLLQAKWAKYRQELIQSERKARAQQVGREPDFGEPAAVQAALGAGVDAVLELLHTSRRLGITIAPGASHWTLRLELEPEPSGTANDLVMSQITGSTEPLKKLPSAAAIAVLARSSAQQRRQGAQEMLGQLGQVFGSRLDEPARTTLARVLQNLAAGRGDSTQAALILGQPPGLLVQGEVMNPDTLKAGLNELPQVLTSPAFSEPISDWFGPPRLLPPPQHPFTGGSLLAFGSGGRFGRLAAPGLASFWQISEAEYHVSLSSPPGVLPFRASLKPEETLADLRPVNEALDRIEASSLVVLIRPELLGLVSAEAGSAPESILLMHIGRRGRSGYLEVEVPISLLEASIASAVQP